jgi:hypothetical protein
MIRARLIYEGGRPFAVPEEPVLGTTGPQLLRIPLDPNNLEQHEDPSGGQFYIHRGEVILG